MTWLIKGGRLVDPHNNVDEVVDILIENGKIVEIGPALKAKGAKIIDASEKVVSPGLIDMHVHSRQPGQEHKETIFTCTRAAANGGFTTIVCEPNTCPPIDTAQRVRYVLEVAKKESLVNFYTKACITKGMEGKEAVDVEEVAKAGAVGLTDDGLPVRDIGVMIKAAKEAKRFNLPLCPHCEEAPFPERPEALSSEAEYIRTYISDVLVEVSCPFHFLHISLGESVELIAKAKEAGLPVTAEATPHHFTLSQRDIKRVGQKIDPLFIVNPPLRSPEDVAAIKKALRDNTIDVIASDHAPHTSEEKNSSNPPSGIIGLETTLGIVLTHLVEPGLLTLAEAIRKMSTNPAKILGIRGGELSRGMPADVTIIDPNEEWTVNQNEFASKGRNCPFDGWRLKGRAVMVMVRGKIIMSRLRRD